MVVGTEVFAELMDTEQVVAAYAVVLLVGTSGEYSCEPIQMNFQRVIYEIVGTFALYVALDDMN